MTYYEYTFTLVPASTDACDLLSAFLAEAGFETFDTVSDVQLKAWVQQSLCDTDAIEGACASLHEIMDTQVTYKKIVPEHRNWNERWERESFHPIIVDGRLCIHAPGQDDGGAETSITINPRMAFGTGSHATTSLLLHILLGERLEGMRVVDAGCGTGVLGILCLMRGARELLAYDIDRWSVDNTVANLQLNNLAAEVLEGDAGVLEGRCGYDLILANINRNILLQEVPRMLPALVAGGRIIVSGFYVEDAAILIEAFACLGLQVEAKEEKDGWCAIIFRLSLGNLDVKD